jgi:hypothetical protein
MSTKFALYRGSFRPRQPCVVMMRLKSGRKKMVTHGFSAPATLNEYETFTTFFAVPSDLTKEEVRFLRWLAVTYDTPLDGYGTPT